MKKITKFFSYMLILIIVIAGIFILTNTLSNSKNNAIVPDDYVGDMTDVAVIDALHEYVKDGPSDIDGMTKSQKIEAGLNPIDGSDTDMDGLTDKEEIEKYKSDPLKASTAGDLYTDGYKVAHDMDLQKKYDYDGDISHTISGITLTAVSPFDIDAKVNNCTGSIDDYKKYESGRDIVYDDVYEVYKINGYSNNTFNIIKKEAFVTNKPADDDEIGIKVFRDNNDKASDISISESNGIYTVTVSEDMNPMCTYTVFLYHDRGMIQGFLSSFNDVISGSTSNAKADGSAENSDYQSLITHWPLACFVFNVRPKILISDTATEQQIADTCKMATACYKESRPIRAKNLPAFTEEDCIPCSTEDIERKTKRLDAVFGISHIYAGIMSNTMFFSGCYSPYGAYSGAYAAEREEAEELAKEFVGSDRFCFRNFKTDYYMNDHGVCSGYAWLVSLIHDNDGLSSLSGSYKSKIYDSEVSYSMDANNPDNLTLLDRYVSDYKAYKFMNYGGDKEGFDGPISDDEKEFTKMASAYWAEYNDNMNTKDVAMKGFISNKSQNYLSWETIKNMEAALDEDKILEWSFNLRNLYEGAHTVNITGYKVYDCDGENDTVLFDVYDSNLPSDKLTLKCKKIISSRGDESFTFDYFVNDKYYANFDFTSSPDEKTPYDQYGAGDTCRTFFVFDSELNCLSVPLEL